MRIRCFSCGKQVSTDISDLEVFRGVATCPECIEVEGLAEEKLSEALFLALQYVPLESKDVGEQKEIDKIYDLIKEAKG